VLDKYLWDTDTTTKTRAAHPAVRQPLMVPEWTTDYAMHPQVAASPLDMGHHCSNGAPSPIGHERGILQLKVMVIDGVWPFVPPCHWSPDEDLTVTAGRPCRWAQFPAARTFEPSHTSPTTHFPPHCGVMTPVIPQNFAL
jgi:hypothetical protein